MTHDLAAKAARLTGTAGTILERKGRVVHAIGPDESVYAAVEKLSEYKVGALLVMRDGALLGVVSERDYARRVILQGLASKQTPVKDVMSTPVVCVELATPLNVCMHLINDRRIRHLPVMDAGRVVGVISIGDLVRAILDEQEATIEQLNSYVRDPYPR